MLRSFCQITVNLPSGHELADIASKADLRMRLVVIEFGGDYGSHRGDCHSLVSGNAGTQ